MAAKHASTMQAITERSHELTEDLDVADPTEILRLLRTCDAGILSGYKNFPGLSDEEIRQTVDAITAVVVDMLRSSPYDSAIILSGAGTSGRIAFSIARAFNAVLEKHGKPRCIHYLIAGGDAALLKAQEGVEDNAGKAVDDLERIYAQGRHGKGFGRVLYIGITCGLSATYVAAQLQYTIKQPHYASVLLGFNPIEYARKVRVPEFGHTFFDVASQLQQAAKESAGDDRRHFILTPVVGPEAITGSTRLKGGSATKILLESIFGKACAQALQLPYLGRAPSTPLSHSTSDSAIEFTSGKAVRKDRSKKGPQAPPPAAPSAYKAALQAYDGVIKAVYDTIPQLAVLVEAARESLDSKGSIFYVGTGGTGLVGLIDASEQVPTFGAAPADVQAFVQGGWHALKGPAIKRTPSIGPHQGRNIPPSLTLSEAPSSPLQRTVSDSPKPSPRRLKADDRLPSSVLASVVERGLAAAGTPTKSRLASQDSDLSNGEATEESSSAADTPQGASEEGPASKRESTDNGHMPESRDRLFEPPSRSPGSSALSAAKPSPATSPLLKPSHSEPSLANGVEEVLLEDDPSEGKLSVSYFLERVLPRARHTDTVVLLRGAGGGESLSPGVEAAVLERKKLRGGVVLALVDVFVGEHDRILCLGDSEVEEVKPKDALAVRSELERLANVHVLIRLPAAAAAPLVPGVDSFSELAVKLVLNAVSTGAHVLVGKVFRSLMIDLRVSNHKLLHRAVAIVEKLIGVPRPAAIDCVLRSIYGLDHGDELDVVNGGESQNGVPQQNGFGAGAERKELRNLTQALALVKTWSSSVHVLQAAEAYKVVPTALLLATGKFTVESAHEYLQETPTVRKLIEQVLQDA